MRFEGADVSQCLVPVPFSLSTYWAPSWKFRLWKDKTVFFLLFYGVFSSQNTFHLDSLVWRSTCCQCYNETERSLQQCYTYTNCCYPTTTTKGMTTTTKLYIRCIRRLFYKKSFLQADFQFCFVVLFCAPRTGTRSRMQMNRKPGKNRH